MEERGSEKADILLMNCLDMLASGMQKEGEQSFWEFFSHQIVLIPFEESPGPSGLVQTVVQPPCLLHFHVFECREGQGDYSWGIHRWWWSL